MSDVFNIVEEDLVVKIKGTEYPFRAPTSKEEETLQIDFKNMDVATSDKHPSEVYKDFLSKLGLPREVLDGLTTKNILNLFSFAVGANSKKN